MPTSILLRADQVIEEACLLQRISLLLAPLIHARLFWECPFTGVERKSPWSSQTDANDPKGTSRPDHHPLRYLTWFRKSPGSFLV
jgi:hypothetical protein